MKNLDFDTFIGWFIGSCAVIAVIGLIIVLLIPKPHNGYYIKALDRGVTGEYVVYNNWRSYPDDIAFASSDYKETLNVYRELTK